MAYRHTNGRSVLVNSITGDHRLVLDVKHGGDRRNDNHHLHLRRHAEWVITGKMNNEIYPPKPAGRRQWKLMRRKDDLGAIFGAGGTG